jgi:nicotinamide riboside transporter PnuC
MFLLIYGWIVTAICLIGTVLNVKKIQFCFVLWTIGNFLWLILDLYNKVYSRSLLDIIQLVLAIWGYVAWKKENNKS